MATNSTKIIKYEKTIIETWWIGETTAPFFLTE